MTMAEKKDSPRPSGLALVPFAVFAAFYVGLSLYADHLGFEMPWYKVSMPVAFVVASAVSLIIGRRRTLDEKVEVYARGMGEPNMHPSNGLNPMYSTPLGMTTDFSPVSQNALIPIVVSESGRIISERETQA